jgi:hypothetical protein
LGIDTIFPSNKSWAFVSSSHVFSDSQNPFPYPASDTVTISVNTTRNFKAIKLGDVNYDRNPAGNVSYRSKAETMELYYDTVILKSMLGEIIKVQIRSKKLQEVMGFQFTMNWNNKDMTFENIKDNPLGVFYGDRWIKDGTLTVSWNEPEAKRRNLEAGELLFELIFKSVSDFDKTTLSLSDDRVPREAFDGRYNNIGLKLDAAPIMKFKVDPGMQTSSDLRVYPNPATSKFNVEHLSLVEGNGKLRMFDLSGRMVFEKDVTLKKGLNVYPVNLKGAHGSSTYMVQLVYEQYTKTQKVVIGD